MSLIPWSDRSALATFSPNLEDWMEELLRNGFETKHLPKALRGPVPPVNLSETEKDFVATIELPGMDEKDIDIQVLGDQLVISGERKWEHEKKRREFHRVESQYGSFRRSIELPRGLATDADAIQATFSKGMLEIHLPKVEPRPLAKVKIKAK